MLSFKFVESAAGAANYFESADDYYEKEGHQGQWHGKGAEALGLAGTVDREMFQRLLDGYLPDGTRARSGRPQASKDRKGIDFTFSAPKSVSIQALVNGDERLIGAHDAAVKDSLDALQRYTMARKKQDGLSFRERTDKLVAASFRHELSRAQDPQLHTHSIVMNLTQRSDGQWRALSNEDMLRHVKVVGAFYRANLAQRLKDMDYALRETRKGGWELAHITEPAIQHFSARSAQIERLLAARGQDRASATSKQKQILTLASRPKKTDADRAWLKAHWQQTAREAQLDLDKPASVKTAAARSSEPIPDPAQARRAGQRTRIQAADAAIDFAVEHLAERQGIFSRNEVLEVAYGHGATRTDTQAIDAALEAAEHDGRLIAELPLYQSAKSLNQSMTALMNDASAAHFKGEDEYERMTRASWVALSMATRGQTQGEAEAAVDEAIGRGALVSAQVRYTTPGARRSEIRILAMERAGRGAVAPLAAPEQVQAMLAATDLNAGQREAVHMILTTAQRFAGVQGLAGSGKSHMLSQAVRGIHRETAKLSAQGGYKVLGLAPYASQNRALEALGMDSQTLGSFLARKGQHARLDNKTIVFLDEASVVPAHQMEKLMALVERHDARLILSGDRQQTQAVEAGKPFAQLQNAGMTQAFLTEVKRQRNATLKAAVIHAAGDEVPKAVEVLRGHTIEIKDEGARYQAMARAYAALGEPERNDTLIVAGTNEARREINRRVREALGCTGGEAVAVLARVDMTRAEIKSARCYAPGQIIVPERTYSNGLNKGEPYQVIDQDLGNNTLGVRSPSGQRVDFNPLRHCLLGVYEQDTLALGVGEWVKVTRNDPALDLRNGERYRIAAVDAEALTLRKGAADVRLAREGPLHLQYGYATTVHSAQGLTSERVMIEANTQSLTSNKAVFYVAISRPRAHLTVFTNDRADLARAMNRQPKKFAALELRDERNEAFILKGKAQRAAQAKLASQLRKSAHPPPARPSISKQARV